MHILSAHKRLPFPTCVYLGKMGLWGGTSSDNEKDKKRSAVTRPGTGLVRTGSPASVLTRISQADIKTTAEIVERWNDVATDSALRDDLRRWLVACLAWFRATTVRTDCLNSNAIRKQILEYTTLASIKIDQNDRALLQEYLDILCHKIGDTDQIGEEFLVEALACVLLVLDTEVFNGETTLLIPLATQLLAKLDLSTNFHQGNYPKHRSLLNALHQSFVLIRKVSGERLDPDKVGLYKIFKEKIQYLQANSDYYPVRYHAQLITQSLKYLEKSDLSPGIWGQAGYCLLGSLDLMEVFVKVVHLDKSEFDTTVSPLDHFQQAFNCGVTQPEGWYRDIYCPLHTAALQTLQTSERSVAHFQSFKDIINSKVLCRPVSQATPADKCPHVLYLGTGKQLRLLALYGPTPAVRSDSITLLQKLVRCCTQTWGRCTVDQAVQDGLWEDLSVIAWPGVLLGTERAAEKQQAQAALEELKGYLEDQQKSVLAGIIQVVKGASAANPASGFLLQATNKRFCTEDVKLTPYAKRQRNDDCIKIGETTRQIEENVGQTTKDVHQLLPQPVTTVCQERVCEHLKRYYTTPGFVTIPSFLPDESSHHVDTLACRLQVVEKAGTPADNNEWTQIVHHEHDTGTREFLVPDLAALLATSSRVLVVGAPGVGKTTLSRQIAYRWSQGSWGTQFSVVYVLPVRSLQDNDTTLSAALISHCFGSNPPDRGTAMYTSLSMSIRSQLDQPTT